MMARTLEVIVEQITHETAAIKSFKLVSADRSPLPRFSGGLILRLICKLKQA